ncbi:PdaC/SigV domain-containing protein [Clostridium tetani]|uniref:PdaC/SigV domain-containing protein n=1 Tax=Clostridium tetani TaxID=1513 RepID=UPI0024A9B09B|nr:DUF4163 domain-containing protein [Clostridium tetani]
MGKLLCMALTASLVGNTSPAFAINSSNAVNVHPTTIYSSQNLNKESYNISSKKIEFKNDIIDVDMTIPLINGLKDKETEIKINKIIENRAMDFKKDIENMAKEAKKENALTNSYQAILKFKTSFNKNNILSLTMCFYEYTGGAHGLGYNESLNVDLNTGEEIYLKDLFHNKKDYKNIINEFIRDDMTKNPNKYYENASSDFYGIIQDQPYYIEDSNLVVYFNPYEIAPYSEGIKEFKIPLKNFKYGMKKNVLLKKTDVKISTKEVKDNVEGFIGNLRIPVISGWKNEKIQRAINSTIEKDIMNFSEKLKKDGMNYVKESKKISLETMNYFAFTDYSVYQNHKDILSIRISYSQYTGGAHGMDSEKTYNIDLNTGNIIKLKDVFKEGTNYKDMINKEIKKQIEKGNSSKDAFPIEGFESILEDQSFNIEKGNVILVFQRGDIAPYAMGTLEFVIPLNKNIANNNFLN